jgi:hypothetical protein
MICTLAVRNKCKKISIDIHYLMMDHPFSNKEIYYIRRTQRKCMKFVWYLIVFFFIISFNTSAQDDSRTGFPLIYQEDFEEPGAIRKFVFSDPAPWFVTGGKDGGKALEYAGRGDYKPRVRSPLIIGLVDNLLLEDFVLEADVLQTGREYGHRDMCFYFGFQDSTRFYYVHLASQADPVAHTIHIVNDLPRKSIAKERTDGIHWTDGYWHHIRLERSVVEGEINMYFDDMETPVMVANDKTFRVGYVGFGSFDDSGKIDNICIWAKESREKKSAIFMKKY